MTDIAHVVILALLHPSFSCAVATETVLEAWNIALIAVGVSILVAGDVCLTIIASLYISLGQSTGEQTQTRVYNTSACAERNLYVMLSSCFIVGNILGFILMAVAWLTFPPVAIPLGITLVTCISCRDSSTTCGMLRIFHSPQ